MWTMETVRLDVVMGHEESVCMEAVRMNVKVTLLNVHSSQVLQERNPHVEVVVCSVCDINENQTECQRRNTSSTASNDMESCPAPTCLSPAPVSLQTGVDMATETFA